MHPIKNNKILLPVQQAKFAYRNKMVKSLAIYLYLKMFTDSKINANSPLFIQLKKDLNLNTNRTFKKHIQQLINLNWIGYSSASNTYFIRSFKFIRLAHKFRIAQGVKVELEHFKNFQYFIAATLISKEVRDHEYYWDVVKKRKLKKVSINWADAKHSTVFSHTSNNARPKYFGLCNKSIANILGCKQTRACVIKNKAAALGYLKVSHRYNDLLLLDKPDFKIRSYINEQYPEMAGRIRYWRVWINNVKHYKLVIQLHDQIVSTLTFKSLPKFSALTLPTAALKSIASHISKAA